MEVTIKRVFLGKPGIIHSSKMKSILEGCEGGANLTAVSIGGQCLSLPKDSLVNTLCVIRVRCLQSGEEFAFAGYVSESFISSAATAPCKIFGSVMTSRVRKGSHRYELEVLTF